MSTPVVGLATSTPVNANTAVNAIDVNQAGGYIVNPSDAIDQGQSSGADPAVLYINQVTSASTVANTTTIALQPGQSYSIIPYTTTPVSVASKIGNHRFTAVMWPS